MSTPSEAVNLDVGHDVEESIDGVVVRHLLRRNRPAGARIDDRNDRPLLHDDVDDSNEVRGAEAPPLKAVPVGIDSGR